MLIGAISFGVWYQFYYNNKNKPEFNYKNDLLLDKKNLDKIIENPYLPDSSLNPGLAKCINLYRDTYIKRAFVHCEEFLNTPATDEEKSVALTVMGVMFDDAGRYPLSIERFKKAIQYDPKNFHAYYNLTLAYRHSGMFNEARQSVMKAKELAPNDPRVSLLAGNILNDANDPRLAMKMYEEGIAANPNDPYLIYNLAVSQFRQGSIPEAIENFRKAVIASGTGQVAVLSHGHLGSIYFNRGDFEGAEHHFREALRLKPSDAKYLYNLGTILLKQKKNEEAISLFQKALDAGANEPEVYRYIAEAFYDLRQSSLAIRALEKALQIKPNDLDSMFQLADIYYSTGDMGQAEEMFRRIIKNSPGDSNTETALINLGIILDDMDRHSEAISALEQAISLNPKNENAYYNLGLAYKNSGEPTKAIENWRKANSLNPEVSRNREAIADYYLENRFYQEAVKEYSDILRTNNSEYKIKLKLSDAYMNLKSFESAEKELLDVLNNSKDANDLKIAHRKLALVYASGDTRFKAKAKDEAYRGAHIDPDDMESKLILAKVLIDSGSLMDREKAIDELSIIVRSEVKPKIAALAYNYLGLCYYKNGEYKRALREFQNSIDLDPSLTEAYENKRAARASYEDSIDRSSSF
ncbi:MAG: tetratricopeptide repeat protein [Leptospiraceae bacterium]|nr:tetratricopeptide repeat protein [Leptospiraceae bacterium]NUM41751.1 tetratricopeptide repeat protein [Leptospiraceae bacterium]